MDRWKTCPTVPQLSHSGGRSGWWSPCRRTGQPPASGDRLLVALGRLPRRQREVLTLRYYLDLSEAQIADALNISAGSVKVHAHRGLAALRTDVEGTS